MTVLPFHIIAGSIALTSGALALYACKGGRLHRKSGIIFVYAMMILTFTGAVMGALQSDMSAVIPGLLTFYLVLTALLTVRHSSNPNSPWITFGAMLVGLIVVITCIFSIGMAVFNNTVGNTSAGFLPLYFIFGAVALLAVLGDARLLLAQDIPWAHRIARHLWRMCLALWIATASFFLGQADELPEQLRIMPLLCTPVLLVALLMLYWLVRVLFTKWRPST
jgi:peptidoglycan/LPS O-acetylase OafA/YrhL